MVRSVTSINRAEDQQNLPGVTARSCKTSVSDGRCGPSHDRRCRHGPVGEPREMAPAMISSLATKRALSTHHMVVDAGSGGSRYGSGRLREVHAGAVSTTHFVDTARLPAFTTPRGTTGQWAVLLVNDSRRILHVRNPIDVIARDYDVYAQYPWLRATTAAHRVTARHPRQRMVEFLDAVDSTTSTRRSRLGRHHRVQSGHRHPDASRSRAHRHPDLVWSPPGYRMGFKCDHKPTTSARTK